MSPSIHERFLRRALELAKDNAISGRGGPFGAIVARGDEIVAEGVNLVTASLDPTAHAEMIALREASAHAGNYRLPGCDLYATLEPCAMCAGALVHARLRRLVYGAPDPKAGAAGSVLSVVNHPALNHRMQVSAGVLAGRCMEMLQAFFRQRRAEHAP